MFKVAQDLHQEPPSITWQAYSRDQRKGSHGSNETGEEASYIPIPNFLDLGSALGIIVSMYILNRVQLSSPWQFYIGRIWYIPYFLKQCPTLNNVPPLNSCPVFLQMYRIFLPLSQVSHQNYYHTQNTNSIFRQIDPKNLN